MREAGREIWVECRVPHPCIYYVRHTADAHEGLCVASTVPHPEGRVRFLTARERRRELEALLRALAEETDLEVVRWGEGPPPDAGEPADTLGGDGGRPGVHGGQPAAGGKEGLPSAKRGAR